MAAGAALNGADAASRAVRSTRARRLLAAVGIVVFVGAGFLVHTQLPDTDGSDIAGDALYAAVAYLLVVAAFPRWSPVAAGALAAAWCVGVELFQLTGLPELWGAHWTPIMLVLGTVFNARDLLVYVVTVGALAVGDLLLRRWRRRPV